MASWKRCDFPSKRRGFRVFFLRFRATLVCCTRYIVPHCWGSVARTIPAAPLSAGECMVPSGLSRIARNGGVALLALFAGFLLSPRVCEAGCGDSVQIHNPNAPMTHSLPDPLTHKRSADRADHRLPHRPCQGPGCSNSSVPPPTPATGTTVSIDRWVLAPGDTFPNPVTCSNVLVQPVPFVTDGFRLSILRPPR